MNFWLGFKMFSSNSQSLSNVAIVVGLKYCNGMIQKASRKFSCIRTNNVFACNKEVHIYMFGSQYVCAQFIQTVSGYSSKCHVTCSHWLRFYQLHVAPQNEAILLHRCLKLMKYWIKGIEKRIIELRTFGPLLERNIMHKVGTKSRFGWRTTILGPKSSML